MEPTEIAEQIRQNGYCIVEDVIPAGEVGRIRERVVRAQEANDAANQAREKATRARGHRIGARGVGVLKQAINHDQSFAPYLADRRIVGALEIFFGPWLRISCTDAVVNHPGNERGYWHADWPFNQTNASNVPAPLPGRDDARVVAVDADRFHRRQRRDAAVAGHAPEGTTIRRRETSPGSTTRHPSRPRSTPRAGRERCCSPTAGSGTRWPPTRAAAPGWR